MHESQGSKINSYAMKSVWLRLCTRPVSSTNVHYGSADFLTPSRSAYGLGIVTSAANRRLHHMFLKKLNINFNVNLNFFPFFFDIIGAPNRQCKQTLLREEKRMNEGMQRKILAASKAILCMLVRSGFVYFRCQTDVLENFPYSYRYIVENVSRSERKQKGRLRTRRRDSNVK